MRFQQIVIATFLLLTTLVSCNKDKNKVELPPIVNEEELITTLQIYLVNGNDTSVFSFSDPDGEGGSNGITDTIKLNNNANYTSYLKFLDESNPAQAKDITGSIREEDKDHLVCYTTNSNLTISISDKDGNNLPVGLNSNWSVLSNGAGSLTVSLKHQPGIKNGSCNVGETDIEVVFPVVIQ